MKTLLVFLGCILGGGAIGLFSALWYGGMVPGGPRMGSNLDVGGWSSDWSIGSENASPYVRARIARFGLLAMRKDEAVYFGKAVDDLGDPMVESCTYRVSGRSMPARWWSITLYNAESYLPSNDDGALSFDATRVPEGNEDWSFIVSPSAPGPDENGVDEAWVSSRAAGTFDLTLRLYSPTPELIEHPKRTLRSPTIERLSCGEASQ
ncbi:MAG: DUF1214 domain-containing protein [Pseudomonadota bacterium]